MVLSCIAFYTAHTPRLYNASHIVLGCSTVREGKPSLSHTGEAVGLCPTVRGCYPQPQSEPLREAYTEPKETNHKNKQTKKKRKQKEKTIKPKRSNTCGKRFSAICGILFFLPIKTRYYERYSE